MASSSSSQASFAQALVAGGLAGTSVDVALFPLDTLKTRLQSSEGFLKAGGFNGVYRGLGSVVVGSAPGAAAFFTTYEQLKANLPKLVPSLSSASAAPIVHMLASSGGEIAACMIRVPTEVVKSRQQTSKYGSGNSLNAARRVLAESGLRGFYQGFGSTIAREIPFTCIQFPLYEYMKATLAVDMRGLKSVDDLPATQAAICGSIAGGIAAALTTPLDVAKTRIMLSVRNGSSETIPYSSNFITTMSRIAREEGFKTLFRGIVPRVTWISIGGAIFLGVYERAKQTLMRSNVLS
ncbi:mitochondrial carrier [Cystobasidium minutum MCA 4210]|uniref:mitochondrial carrier n=1 Tax=Cystobasidium minutum MCA 4210 TaxID=1397322 RepID=UPI0034CFF8F9|eukprot:jgi/Rhomi1/168160/fgenesh1_kg.2_\